MGDKMNNEITKEQLEKIYKENTNSTACEILGVSKITFMGMIERAGIRKKGKGNKNKYEIV